MRALWVCFAVFVLFGCVDQVEQTEKPAQANAISPENEDFETTDVKLADIIPHLRGNQPIVRCLRSDWSTDCSKRSVLYTSQENWDAFYPLSKLVGQRFRGTPEDGSTERAADIQQWEWALGGTAILIRHALEDGSYGGDTYVYKDAKSGDLVYVYITNAGFRTEGVIELNDDASYTAEEDVAGHPTITKVRSTSVINGDGSTNISSQYFDGGEWVPGHAFTYVPTDKPLPRLNVQTPKAK
ncbi:MAG: hypothetical protein AAGG45_07595 [Pseudomonadota bacterium]